MKGLNAPGRLSQAARGVSGTQSTRPELYYPAETDPHAAPFALQFGAAPRDRKPHSAMNG